MASTILNVQLPTGYSGLTVTLYPDGSDSAGNTPDTLTEETNREGLYSATITEALDGIHYVKILDGSSLLATGWVDLVDDTSTYQVIDNYPQAASLLAAMFLDDSGTTYASAVAGSVVREIASNATGALGGTGSDTVALTLKDSTPLTLADVETWVTTDAAGLSVHAGTLRSSDAGTLSFSGTFGDTYYVWRHKSGYNFVNPQSITAAAAVTVQEGTAASSTWTDVDICNAALLRAGVTKRITSLLDTDTLSALCNDEYSAIRDQLLEDHPWHFATKYDNIASEDATDPDWYWTYRYALPSDCVLLLGLESEGIKYEQADDGFIYTNEPAPLKIRYISRESAVSNMPDSFKQAWIAKLSATLCLGLTKDLKRVDYLEARYDRLISDARFADSSKKSYQPLDSSTYQNARFVGPEVVDNEGGLQ